MFVLHYPVSLSMSPAPLGLPEKQEHSVENGLPKSERVESLDSWL